MLSMCAIMVENTQGWARVPSNLHVKPGSFQPGSLMTSSQIIHVLKMNAAINITLTHINSLLQYPSPPSLYSIRKQQEV